MKVVWSVPALADLVEARAFVAVDKPEAATQLARRILHVIELIADSPRIGRKGEVTGTRELVIAGTPYRIIYRIKGRRLEIVRVWHGKRRWPVEE